MIGRPLQLAAIGGFSLALLGCASVSPVGVVGAVNTTLGKASPVQAQLLTSAEAQAGANTKANALLLNELSQAGAVQLAMLNSPDMQAMLASGVASAANAAQGGRIANPTLSFERMHATGELELARALSFGLLDLLTLPQRQAVAKLNVDKVQLQLAQQLVRQLSDVKLAWVGAIAANQRLLYAQQVQRSANASAELAKRLKAVGNFSWLQQASQQQFASDAAIQLATAQHTNISATQHLVRLLGLSTSQEALMRLPKRLPSIPKQTLSPEDISAVAMDTRLDVQLAKLDVTRLLGSNTLAQIDSFTDVEWGIRGVDKKNTADGSVSQSNGFEVAIRLPIFDWGDNKRVALSANSLMAAKNYESTMLNASSELRVSYSAYRTAYDLAAHYQNEVIPMRTRMAEENQYSYNGMLISVFELLADARQQVAAVTQSLNAVEQFWASEAALQNSLLGAPSAAVSVSAATAQADSPGH